MNFGGIKLFLAYRKLRSFPAGVAFGSGGNSQRTVGIILDRFEEGTVSSFRKFFQEMDSDIDVEVICCFPGATKENAGDNLVFRSADISWAGKITNKEVVSFQERDFALLISFTEKDNPLLDYLISATDATLKVGRRQEKQIYDLVISTSFEEVEVFISELRRYLPIINRTN